MEISVGEYGRAMFEIMLCRKDSKIEHWESIRAKAEPLVRELIRLNSEMKGREGGYKITGYIDENGKKKLTNNERIRSAQEKLWTVKVSDLKEGDRIWVNEGDFEMYIGQDEPVYVVDITKNGVYVEMSDYGEDYTITLGKKQKVLKAPDDFGPEYDQHNGVYLGGGKQDLYESDKYWLEQADKLGI